MCFHFPSTPINILQISKDCIPASVTHLTLGYYFNPMLVPLHLLVLFLLNTKFAVIISTRKNIIFIIFI